jgi:hypothetical protein
VRALVRDRGRAAAIDPAPSEIVTADLTDEGCDLSGACREVQTVISVAGQSTSRDWIPDWTPLDGEPITQIQLY